MNRLSPVAAIVGIVCFWAGQQTPPTLTASPQAIEATAKKPGVKVVEIDGKKIEIVDGCPCNRCEPTCDCKEYFDCAVPEQSPDDRPIEPTPATVNPVPSPPVAVATPAPPAAATGFYYTSGGCANGSCSPRAYSQPVYQRSYQPQYQRPARRGLFGRRR